MALSLTLHVMPYLKKIVASNLPFRLISFFRVSVHGQTERANEATNVFPHLLFTILTNEFCSSL